MRTIRSWFWPGVITVALLTVLAGWFLTDPIDQQLTDAANAALSADNSWASADIDGRDLTLKGVAPSEEALAAALGIAASTPGVRTIDNQATLLPLAEPFSFVITKSDDGILLSGNVPFGDSRARILASAENAMPGIEILDELAVARGAPEGFLDLVDFALSQAAQLTNGEVEISGKTYSISGTAANAADYDAINAALRAPIPGNGKPGEIKLEAAVNTSGG
ncbi:BON domain-containing protein [Phyllobacterium sp. BT25]|uniref:BON domain-containing protein n=1 Tax=Phyllobacterium pellucidum TaxID=2740464 RepID=A0A849VLC8_9HYPH|nr:MULTISPECIES: BON domain-containing protein [Phyllobacterium]NTS30106.1 BON domain-containing protein [Phyllobacterium pellucidum]UGY08094.1 BON domain-containing protein [Phyllobacterium sp. T1018]SFI50921.1 BON domain-containing protein [Phyllobacterium sp. CL33Tsu]